MANNVKRHHQQQQATMSGDGEEEVIAIECDGYQGHVEVRVGAGVNHDLLRDSFAVLSQLILRGPYELDEHWMPQRPGTSPFMIISWPMPTAVMFYRDVKTGCIEQRVVNGVPVEARNKHDDEYIRDAPFTDSTVAWVQIVTSYALTGASPASVRAAFDWSYDGRNGADLASLHGPAVIDALVAHRMLPEHVNAFREAFGL